MSRKLHVDVGWLWSGYVGRALVYLGLTVVLTRGLGSDEFGQLSLFLAVTLGVSQVAGTWPFLAVPVLSAHGRTIGAAFRPAAKVAAVATAIALLIALPVSVAIHSGSPISLLSLVGYSVALIGLQGVYSILQTQGRMPTIAALQSGERGLALLFALVLAAAGSLTVLGSEALLALSCLATCVAAYAWVVGRATLAEESPEEEPDHTLSAVMGAVGAMGIVSVCAYGVTWIDIFILAAYRPDSDVGVYSLAYQVFMFVVQLGSLWAVAALPRHARSTASGDTLASQLPLRRLMSATAAWSAVVAAIAIVSAIVVPHAFGAEFEDSLPPLMVLFAGSGICGAAYFLVLPALIAAGRTVLIAKVSVISVTINLVLDLILVPQIGVMGPALATVGQTLFATAALAAAALGHRAAIGVASVGVPAVVGVALLAVDPDDVLLLSVATATVLASVALALAFVGGRAGLVSAFRG